MENKGELPKPKPYLKLYHLLLQEDKSSWTKIDVATDKMLTKFITIKGEDVFAKQPYKDLKVSWACFYLKRTDLKLIR